MRVDILQDLNERALSCCLSAQQAEERGDFEGARVALQEYWYRVGDEPNLNGLSREVAGEVLLHAGTLTGRIGSAKQIKRAQEIAQDLLTKSVRYFEESGLTSRAIEAQRSLAFCYLRQGRFDDARIILREAGGKLGAEEIMLRARVETLRAQVEREALCWHDALLIHRQIAQYIDFVDDDYIKGIFHNEHGAVYLLLGLAERNADYLDKAFEQLAGAVFHFEQCGHTRYVARSENNIGYIFIHLSKYDVAHEYLGRARHRFELLKDAGSVAQVDESRARAMLGQGRPLEALKTIKNAVSILEKGDEASVFAEALRTYGQVLARINDQRHALSVLRRAAEISRQINDAEGEGRALLILLEECSILSAAEVCETYAEAVRLLNDPQDSLIAMRLVKVAARVISMMKPKEQSPEPEDGDIPEGFVLADSKKEHEKYWVKKALIQANGNALKASRLLGMKKHQRIYQLIEEHDLHDLQLRHHQKKGGAKGRRTSSAGVSPIGEMLQLILPAELAGKSLITHPVSTESLSSKGIHAGDEVVVVRGEGKENDPVAILVYGHSIMLGTLRYLPDGRLYLEGDDPGVSVTPYAEGEATIEGRIGGFCKAEDLNTQSAIKVHPV